MKKNYRFKIILIAIIGFFCSDLIAQNIECTVDWRYARIGDLPRVQYAGDIDNDGITEIVVSAYSIDGGYWYIMEYDNTTDKYRQVWVSDQYLDSNIYSIRVMDLGGDGIQEILVCDKFVNVQVFNANNMNLVGEFDLFTAGLNEMILADADNDGVEEIVVASDLKTFIINTQTFNVEWEIDQGGRHMQVGQVDSDPALEIVFSDGEVLEFNNGITTEEWNAFDDSFLNSRFVQLVQADTDPAKEIAIAIGKMIYIYDASDQILMNSIEHDEFIYAMLYEDYNLNGTKDLILGDKRGDVIAYDISLNNNTQIVNGYSNQIELNNSGACSLNIADSDNSGMPNIILSEGCESNYGDHIRIYDKSGNKLWESYPLDASFTGLELVDINQDGDFEFLATPQSTVSNYGLPTLLILDAETGKELDLIPDFSVYRISTIEKGDIDNDGDVEIVTAGPSLSVYNQNLQIQNTVNVNPGTGWSLTLADLDLNGSLEIIYRSNIGFHCYNKDLNFYGENLYNGTLNQGSINVVNILGDEKPEIVTCNKELLVMDNEFNLIYNSPAFSTIYRDVAVTDWDEDGELDIIGATSSGSIHFIKTSDFSIFDELTLTNSSEYVDALLIDDINNDGVDEMVIAHNDIIFVYTKTGILVEIAQHSIGSGSNVWESLEFADLNNDGLKEIVISNDYAITILQTNCYGFFTSTKFIPEQENQIQLFPNPSSFQIQIEIDDELASQIEKITLFDISGKRIKEYLPTTSFSIEDLQKGIYFMTFKTKNGEIITKKVVKM